MNILDEQFSESFRAVMCEKIDQSNMKKSKKEEKKDGIKNLSEKLLITFISEASDSQVSSKKELKQVAMAMAKKSFGKENIDEKKIDGLVDEAISDSTDEDGNVDWEKAAGIVVGSYNS